MGDWVFENNPTLKNRAKCGKLSLPYCGPYQVIELNRNARIAKLQVLRGRDKWVHMRWLSRCDPKILDRKRVEPWYGNYKDRCSLQAIPETEQGEAKPSEAEQTEEQRSEAKQSEQE